MRCWIWILGLIVCACSGKGEQGNKELNHAEEVKLKQYVVAGQRLYIEHCSNCHQADGSGLAKLFPPVAQSDFIDKNFEQVICLIKFGISGEIVVNGITYNQPMPAIPELSDLDIAEIASYIYNSWGRERGIVSVKEVGKILPSCGPETH